MSMRLQSLIAFYIVAAQLYTVGEPVMKERGQNVSFSCTADGIPMPIIVWRKDGQLIIRNNKRNIAQSSSSTGFRSNTIPGIVQATSILTITGLTGSDNGSYSCRADNEANIGVFLSKPYQLTVVERKQIYYDVKTRSVVFN